jgi:hypothetical protein
MLDKQGTTADLKLDPKAPYGPTASKAPIVFTGSEAPINATPVVPSSIWQSKGNTISGQGTAAKLDDTPRKAWDNAPPSDRAVKQTK